MGSLSQLQLNWLSNLITFQPLNEQIRKASLFISPFYPFSALPTINTFNYGEGLSLFALMHLGLIMRTQDPDFSKASPQKELFIKQHCCIIGIILESHEPFFKKCFGDVTACSPIENAAGKLASQVPKRKKTFLSAVESGIALCHEIPKDPLGITQQI